MNSNRVVIFGEVLFDTFPDGSKTLGGAPFNVAWHLKAFGLDPLIITRIGDDAAGEEVRDAMMVWGMDTAGLQIDPQLPTGRVQVQFHDGEPQYTILHPAAFDAIDYAQATKAVGNHRGLLYHGSLALRSPQPRQALEQLRGQLQGTIFMDVNLRSPWWQREEILGWIAASDWVKLNEYELQQLSSNDGSSQEQATRILKDYGLTGVILTRGERGAVLLTAERIDSRVRPQNDIQLVDTVGAGDAFTSVMLLGLVKQWSLALTLNRAQDFASKICGHRGATVRDTQFYQPLVQQWKFDA